MPATVSFDHESADLIGPGYWAAVNELRGHGPLVWVDRGFWAATSFETVRRIAQDWETFSSAQGIALSRPSPEQTPYIMPLEVDPPRQRTYRQHVNRHFHPTVLAAYTDAGWCSPTTSCSPDRPNMGHIGFGMGPHRCIGSNLARLQIRLAVGRLLDRLGTFRIPAGASVTYVASQTRGPASLPLDFTGSAHLTTTGGPR
jgi:cytochrome P450